MIVSIGDYPNFPEKFQVWKDLSCDNDVILVNQMLSEQFFLEENIVRLLNKEATHDRIIKAFDELLNNVEEGDLIYFHFSGHGQQILDDNGDEEDGFDEALVAYNAPIQWYDGYDGKEHVSDDELKSFISKLRVKLGNKGQIIFVLDSCHSGTGTRGGNEEANARGTDFPCAPAGYKPELIKNRGITDNDLDYTLSNELASVSTFSGCRADQVNYEFKDLLSGQSYGSLSFFFTSAIKDLGENASLRNLFSKIQEGMMLQLNNKQQPILESDNKDELVFNGQLIKSNSFYELSELGKYSAVINGGSLHGLRMGDTIGFFKNDALDFNIKDTLFSGVISTLNIVDSRIDLFKKHEGFSAQRVLFRASLVGPSKDPAILRIKVNLSSKNNCKEITNFLNQSASIQVVNDNYEFLLKDSKDNKNKVQIFIASNGLPLRRMAPIELDEHGKLKLQEYLLNALRVKHFTSLSIDDPNIDLKLESDREIVGQFQNNEEINVVFKNNKARKVFYKILTINPDQSFEFATNDWQEVNPNESVKTPFTFTCDNFDELCGRYQMMLISSESKIELNSLLEMGTSLSRGDDFNEFSQFFESSLSGSRGLAVSTPKIEVSSYFFEILP